MSVSISKCLQASHSDEEGSQLVFENVTVFIGNDEGYKRVLVHDDVRPHTLATYT